MFFASDNGGIVHPDIMARVVSENSGHAMPYGNDRTTKEAQDRIRDLFEAPEAAVHLVATGSAANALALASYIQPYQTVYCTPEAHIENDECGAPEFYTGGAKLKIVPGGDKMAPEALQSAIETTGEGVVHAVQRGALSLTNVTERGGVYTTAQIEALSAVASRFGVPTHLDGARFANVLAATNASPAEMSWRAGVDVLVLGGTKNGCLGVEAVIFFSPEKAWEFELRRKRGGHLFSKNRFLAAQMAGYLAEDLWLRTARDANENAAYFAEGLLARGATFDHPVEANMLFVRFPRHVHQKLKAAGAQYYLSGHLDGPAQTELPCRLVCDWSITRSTIDSFLAFFG